MVSRYTTVGTAPCWAYMSMSAHPSIPNEVVITTLRLRKRSMVHPMNSSVWVHSSIGSTSGPMATLVYSPGHKNRKARGFLPRAWRQFTRRCVALEGISREVLHTGAHTQTGARDAEPERNGREIERTRSCHVHIYASLRLFCQARSG